MFRKFALLSFVLSVVRGQQVGNLTAETHPTLTIQQCSAGGSCTTQQRSVVLDANWRWLHHTANYTNCYTGNTWDTTFCPNPTTCATNCALDGADYSGTYGITTSGNALTMKFVTNGPFSKNVGGRVYLLENDNTYQLFKMVNQEFTFDVDVSQLPCGLNGALYFVSMPANGGLNVGNNKAGAKYGTGYCDSQCPHDMKFINGEANVLDWVPSSNDTNAGTGRYGTCCSEMDIWEANSISAAYTPHVCSSNGRCSGTACGDGDNRYGGQCDKDGCDFNSYRMGDKTFYGPGKTVNTNTKFTVVTQFIGSGSSLSEIRRIYVQGGRVIANSKTAISGLAAYDSITTPFCTNAKTAFGDTNSFQSRGGMAKMGSELAAGMVLSLSIWDDHTAYMLWLDSNYPLTKDPSVPGVARGTCATSSGRPTDVEANSPNAQVIYSNIKYGPINSTFTQ